MNGTSIVGWAFGGLILMAILVAMGGREEEE